MKNEGKFSKLKNIKGTKSLTVSDLKKVVGGNRVPTCDINFECCYFDWRIGEWVAGPPCA